MQRVDLALWIRTEAIGIHVISIRSTAISIAPLIVSIWSRIARMWSHSKRLSIWLKQVHFRTVFSLQLARVTVEIPIRSRVRLAILSISRQLSSVEREITTTVDFAEIQVIAELLARQIQFIENIRREGWGWLGGEIATASFLHTYGSVIDWDEIFTPITGLNVNMLVLAIYGNCERAYIDKQNGRKKEREQECLLFH